MSTNLKNLIRSTTSIAKEDYSGQELLEVSVPASTAAAFYEKVRTSIDYQEDHLLRRNAIRRILRRFLGSDIVIEDMAEHLLQELIWAKYLPNKEVPASMVEELLPVFEKYEPLFRATDQLAGQEETAFYWVLDVMATEIEYAITPPFIAESFVSYMYEEMKKRVTWDPAILISEEEKDLFLYIAVHQILLKSDTATLRFRVFTLYYPEWPGAVTNEQIEHIAKHLDAVITTVDQAIDHPVTQKLAIKMRRKAGVFRVLRDVVEAEGEKMLAALENPEDLDKIIGRALKKRTQFFRSRLSRKVVRTVLFLFLTKMLFALATEIPYDLIIMKELYWPPLAINVLFPPILLAIIGMTVGIPERQNTQDYISSVRALVVGADHDLLNIRMKASSFSAWSRIFTIMYVFMFIFTYTVIAIGLTQIHFNALSVGLFLFFLSLVMFFGIRIRSTTKDLILSSKSTGVIGTIFDFFVLPLVQAGQWLSTKVSKINVFIYFFDFIVESPFKVVIRFMESMTAFVKERKEELQ